ncbi:MAG: bacillithiol biosynthesis deacetylase BshB1 [Armatimonadota bacterium]
MLDILVVSAHPDDAEIGMGATILKMADEGFRVGILDLTDGEPTPTGNPKLRIDESKEAAKLLKVKTRITLDLPNRFLEDSIPARKKVANVYRKLKPSALFIPYWHDAHPDHVAASQIADAARFYSKLTKTTLTGDPHYPSKIFYYFSTHLRMMVKPSFIVDTSKYHEQKLKAVKVYKSQFNKKRGNLEVFDKINALNHIYGLMIRRKYGEIFLCKEEIGIEKLKGLIL